MKRNTVLERLMGGSVFRIAQVLFFVLGFGLYSDIAFGPTTDTAVGRIPLTHPDLGHDGGSALHTKVRNAWTTMGEFMDGRYYEVLDLADAATTADLDHNFQTPLADIGVVLYSLNEGTGELTKLTAATSPALSDFTINAGSAPTSQITITNVAGGFGEADIAVAITHTKGVTSLEFLDDVVYSGSPSLGQVLTYDGTNWENGAAAASDLGDLSDVVLDVPPADGDALVYDTASGDWINGTGDLSLKVVSIATPDAVIKGSLLGPDNQFYSTCEVANCSPLGNLNEAITVDLDVIFGSVPATDTNYYLYLKTDGVMFQNGNDDAPFRASVSNTSDFFITVKPPHTLDEDEYIPVAMIHSASAPANAWSGTDSAIINYSYRKSSSKGEKKTNKFSGQQSNFEGAATMDDNSTLYGWTTYDDGAAAIPVDGTGGAPVTTDIKIETAGAILRGRGSLLIECGVAANCQGKGISSDFHIDLADRQKHQEYTFSFEYKYNGTPANTPQFGFYVFDRDNVTLITTHSVVIDDDVEGTRTSAIFKSTFRLIASAEDYRVILHMVEDSGGANGGMYIDNIYLGPSHGIDPDKSNAVDGVQAISNGATADVRLNQFAYPPDKGARVYYQATRRDDTQDAEEFGEVTIMRDKENAAWIATDESTGGDTGLTFAMTGVATDGKLQYTSANWVGGNHAGTLRIVKVIRFGENE